MSKFLETLQTITPVENDAKKQLIGDSVFQVEEAKLIQSKKTGVEYIVVEFSSTHPIEPKGDKKCTIVFGDRISKIYDTEDDKKVQAFANDMFTAGITIDNSSMESLLNSLEEAKGKLVYFRCWMNKFTDKETGEEVEYNKQLIKPSKLITEEMKIAKVPF